MQTKLVNLSQFLAGPHLPSINLTNKNVPFTIYYFFFKFYVINLIFFPSKKSLQEKWSQNFLYFNLHILMKFLAIYLYYITKSWVILTVWNCHTFDFQFYRCDFFFLIKKIAYEMIPLFIEQCINIFNHLVIYRYFFYTCV